MTVLEMYQQCKIQSNLKVMSGYNGKVLCHNFNPNNDKHKEIGKREILSLWADIVTVGHGYSSYARPVMCAYVDGVKEWREENK